LSVPPINVNRKGYNGKEPHGVKKVQWVRVRRSVVGNTPVNDPFKYQEYGIVKEEKDYGRSR
jgi:hypothetical protein